MQNREDTGEYGSELQRTITAPPTVKSSRAEGLETQVATGAMPIAELTSFVMFLFYQVSGGSIKLYGENVDGLRLDDVVPAAGEFAAERRVGRTCHCLRSPSHE